MSTNELPAPGTQKLMRLRELFGRHPFVGDVLPIAGLTVITAGQLHHSDGTLTERIIFMLALFLPLLGRRRWPWETLCVIAAVALVQFIVGVRLLFDMALLVAVYSVALRESTQRAVLAAAILELGILMAAFRWAPSNRVVATLVFLTGMNAAALISGAYVRTRLAYLQTLEERARRLEEERESHAMLAAATERARIAREMHDIVSHSLLVIIAQAEGASFVVEKSPARAVESMRNIAATGRDAMREMRLLLDVLRTDKDDLELKPQPGVKQLQALIDQVRSAGLKVRFDVSGQPMPLPHGVELAIYRIVQESLSNTLKHGKNVTEVAVSVAYGATSLDVSVNDNGALSGDWVEPGYGIHGMRERAEIYGGKIQTGPVDGSGWRVSFHLDLTSLEPS